MIVRKYWQKWNIRNASHTDWIGYFLFGFIPLYIKQIG